MAPALLFSSKGLRLLATESQFLLHRELFEGWDRVLKELWLCVVGFAVSAHSVWAHCPLAISRRAHRG
eukprot:781325-Pleurochrysis_carterae.AAC.1